MSRPTEVIDFDQRRLLLDLATKAQKWAVFQNLAQSAGVHISHHQYMRAKTGYATPDTLAKIAKTLGYSVDRYSISSKSKQSSVADLRGSWVALYLETHESARIVRTWETLYIEQKGSHVSGYYDFLKCDDITVTRSVAYSMRGRIYRDNITGFYWVGQRTTAHGIGTFQLKLRPDEQVAEGYCSFYGHDGFIAASHNYWIRNDGSAQSKHNLTIAESAIAKDSIYFELPKPPSLIR